MSKGYIQKVRTRKSSASNTKTVIIRIVARINTEANMDHDFELDSE
jgi:hypothetical protein